ncbi:hypothetical protein XELAEV_18000049mg [Xenopus laevis]|uniref:Uncharacterized protein n=1 Tax=Xenopus laevis TaxID=8355 RepID=A0A974BR39_XENLA|nr:hypothetical protein XELAEV_18000049mg [Xenopus laevis]
METTITAWKAAQNIFTPEGLKLYSLHTPLWRNRNFPHMIVIPDYHIWAKAGLKFVKDLFSEGQMLNLEQVQATFQVSQSAYFRSCLLRHAAQKQFVSPQALNQASDMETKLQLQDVPKPLSTIYQTIQAWQLHCYNKWLDPEKWSEVLRLLTQSTIASRDKLIQREIVEALKAKSKYI